MSELQETIDYVYLPENTYLNNDNYKVIKAHTSRSNFSIVYLAENNDGERVIIKEFFPKDLVLRDLDGKSLVCKQSNYKSKYIYSKERFLSEAIILKEFKSNRYICDCFDFFNENNTVYIVLRYYEGVTLEDALNKNKISFSKFLKEIYLPLIETVSKIHKKAYIHRDIKPENIIISNAKPIIIDFGSAINYKENQEKNILLTPGFSPIEFYSAKTNQGPFSDIYSLSAILYYYISDTRPLEANERIIEDNLIDINNMASESYGIADLIMKNLSLVPEKRCQSVQEFKTLLFKKYFNNILRK
ncbi:serine/threonine protein kinase [Natronospora cellulosivora (SeqCode)]